MKQVVISLLIVVIGAYLLINLGKRVYDLYRTNDRLVEAQKKLEDAQKRNELLKEEITYRGSDFFAEKEAREKLNMARNGEKVAVIPGLTSTEDPKKPEPKFVPNPQKWYQLFFEP